MVLTRQRWLQLFSLCLALALWFIPTPDGLAVEAWHLFALFTATIFSVVVGAFSILLAAILLLIAAVITGTVEADIAFSGFSENFILLIVVAFLVGRGVVNSGLGARIGYLLVSHFGRSSLGLAYSVMVTDALIAPAFPSNTARSGVLFPIVYSLAENAGSHPWEKSRLQLGAYLMMCTMAGRGLSSALWLTAMAANPIGVAMAAQYDVTITFGSWLLASSLPTLTAMAVVPVLLYRVFPPGITATPAAPAAARQALSKQGPMSGREWITCAAFILMVVGWALADTINIDPTITAFIGLAVLMLANIFTLEDIKASGDALETLIWFAILYIVSSELNRLGFMAYAGDHLGNYVDGLSWPLTFVALSVLYVLIHYLFVSQTAHLLALFGVFLSLSQPEVPASLMAMMLLLATNFFSVLTPQGSSCNVIFVGSGYLTGSEVYRNGGITVLACLAIYLFIGSPWIMLVLP
jgi:DASS family divalent anion:Na+ symporter